jgi:hypothetical protein
MVWMKQKTATALDLQAPAAIKIIANYSVNSSTTGAWSLGCGFLRGARSMVQAATAGRSAADQDVVDAQPRFFWKPSMR